MPIKKDVPTAPVAKLDPKGGKLDLPNAKKDEKGATGTFKPIAPSSNPMAQNDIIVLALQMVRFLPPKVKFTLSDLFCDALKASVTDSLAWARAGQSFSRLVDAGLPGVKLVKTKDGPQIYETT